MTGSSSVARLRCSGFWVGVVTVSANHRGSTWWWTEANLWLVMLPVTRKAKLPQSSMEKREGPGLRFWLVRSWYILNIDIYLYSVCRSHTYSCDNSSKKYRQKNCRTSQWYTIFPYILGDVPIRLAHARNYGWDLVCFAYDISGRTRSSSGRRQSLQIL